MPSKPTFSSTMSLTPFFWQSSYSPFLMAREACHVGVISADAGAEQLQTAARACRLDNRRLAGARLAELLGNRGRERIHRRRADDADLVAGDSRAGERYRADNGRRRRARDELCAHTDLLREVTAGPCGYPHQLPLPAPAPPRRGV
jgi:hypothetical protein